MRKFYQDDRIWISYIRMQALHNVQLPNITTAQCKHNI